MFKRVMYPGVILHPRVWQIYNIIERSRKTTIAFCASKRAVGKILGQEPIIAYGLYRSMAEIVFICGINV